MAPSTFKVLKSAGVTLQASTWRCRVFTPSEPDQRGHPSAGLNMTVTLDNRYPGSCFIFRFGPGSILFFFFSSSLAVMFQSRLEPSCH